MRRTFVLTFTATATAAAVGAGCGSSGPSSGGDAASGPDGASSDAPLGDAFSEAAADGTSGDASDASDAACPVPGSACLAGAPSPFCMTDWRGVMSWRCVDARWCVYPQNPGLYVDPAAGCPPVAPHGGAACSGPAAYGGYAYCPYACADGTRHAMVCAGASSVWCGDAVDGCTLKVAPATDAGSDG